MRPLPPLSEGLDDHPPPPLSLSEGLDPPLLLETFRFDDEGDYEDEISLELTLRILIEYTLRKASMYFFSPEKLARLFSLEGG